MSTNNNTDPIRGVPPLLAARDALAQPVTAPAGPTDEELDAMERQCYLATEVCNDSGCEYVFEHRRYARAVLARWGHHPAHSQAPLDGKDLQRIQRICAIVLGHEFGNSELDSLALELGHHPSILNALPLPDGPAVPEGREPASVVSEPSDEELLATLDKATATFPPRHPEAKALNAVEYPLALELRKARAVLARFGNHSPDATKMVGPAAGDVRGMKPPVGEVQP